MILKQTKNGNYIVKRFSNTREGHWSEQGTIYRNAQLRYTHIMYCTLREEFKQTQCPQCPHRSWRERTAALMWYYSSTKNKLIYQVRANTYDFWLSGQYGKYNSNIFLFHPLGPFPSKMMRCPWILCFDLLPLQYTDLTHEIWRFLVYIYFLDQRFVFKHSRFLHFYMFFFLKV